MINEKPFQGLGPLKGFWDFLKTKQDILILAIALLQIPDLQISE